MKHLQISPRMVICGTYPVPKIHPQGDTHFPKIHPQGDTQNSAIPSY